MTQENELKIKLLVLYDILCRMTDEDQLTPNVYNDFTLSPYAMWTATNVNLIEFPKRTTLYVITVNLNNSSATKQLFYTLNGRLLQTRDVSYINPTLSPGIFEF